MKYDAKIHHRRSIRLTHYDDSLPSAYFVTIGAFGKQCIFGQVVGDQMRENDCGGIVREQWLDTVRIRPQIELDAFIVMPNLHGILWILGPKGEHILWNTGYVIPDVDPSLVGPKSLRPNVGPNGVGPRPNAVRPYKRPTPSAGTSHEPTRLQARKILQIARLPRPRRSRAAQATYASRIACLGGDSSAAGWSVRAR
jgi:hypothetical protein